MLFIRLMRFLRGYICFTASDGFPERFLNLCNQAGVVLWDTKWQKDNMFGCTDRRGYLAMHDCAAPAGVVLKARCKRGLPFFLYEYRKRAGLLIGLVFCIATLAILSSMIWSIEVQGNDTIAEEDILNAMEEQGLRLGVRRQSLDPAAMSEAAQHQLPGVAWMALNLRGSTAVIELREEIELQLGTEPTQPQNIVASKSGQIRVFELYAGSPETSIGQAVAAGGLLAGGRIENLDETYRLVGADAYVVARTSVFVESQARRENTTHHVEIQRTQASIQFLSFRLPLGPAPRNFDERLALRTNFTWSPGGRDMPLGIDRLTIIELVPQQRIKNDRQLQLIAAEAFFDQMHHTLRAAQVLEQDVVFELHEGNAKIVMTGTAYENIGIAQAINEIFP